MACPFFMPVERMDSSLWPHAARLPLGAGWSGLCTAQSAEGWIPSEQNLREYCNLGYARDCGRLPKERAADALRFGVVYDRQGEIAVQYVMEIACRPSAHGRLLYNVSSNSWVREHDDSRIQRMAGCYLEAYLLRRQAASEEIADVIPVKARKHSL